MAAAPAGHVRSSTTCTISCPSSTSRSSPPESGHWAVRALRMQERWAGTFASAVLTVEDRLKDILSGARHSTRQDPRADEPSGRPDLRCRARSGVESRPTHRSCSSITARSRAVSDSTSPSGRWPKRDRSIPRLELRIIGAGEEREPADRVARRARAAGRRHVQRRLRPGRADPALDRGRRRRADPAAHQRWHRHHAADQAARVRLRGNSVRRRREPARSRATSTRRWWSSSRPRTSTRSPMPSSACIGIPAGGASLAAQATERFGKTYRWSEHKKVYTTLVSRLLDAARDSDAPSSEEAARCSGAASEDSSRSSRTDDRPIPK